MKCTYFGHSSFLIETNGKKLLIDPMISSNPIASSVEIAHIHPDYILISHGHEDHVADVETIAKHNPKSQIVSSFEIFSWYQNKGIQGHPMNIGGKWTFDFGTLKYVQAVHSSMLPDGSYGGPSGGFVVWNDKDTFYFAGDTALTMDMKLIPMTCPPLQVAFLPVGDNFTMGYEDALVAAEFIQCDTIVACHYDTFGYIKIDKEKTKTHFAEKGKKLIFPEINQTLTF